MMAGLRIVALALVAGAVAGCDREEVLQGRVDRPAGEVTTTRTASLIVPPSFSLRPGDEDAGQSSLLVDLGDETGTDLAALGTTEGEAGLLRRAGVEQADPEIRDTLALENAILVGQPETVEALLFGDYPETPPTPEVIEEIPVSAEQPEDDSGDDGSFWDWF